MLRNQFINKKAIIKVARALEELNNEVVFVGGAIVSLYTDDPAAEDIRPTKDLDLTFEVTTSGKLEQLREKLLVKGFRQSHEDSVICRFRFEDLLVDVMSTHAVDWAPSNRWFMPGFKRAFTVTLDEQKINVLPLPYFLASKIEAFFDRGINDVYASTDPEDILYIFNYSTNLVNQIQNAEQDVSRYLKDSIKWILNNEAIQEAMPGHLYYQTADERLAIIKEKMISIVALNI